MGEGLNKKSMGYVENFVAFLTDGVDMPSRIQVLNYADKPDLTMRELVSIIRSALGMEASVTFRVPYLLGLMVGYGFDILTRLTSKRFPISAIRIRKFRADTVIDTSRIEASGFRRPYGLEEGLKRSIAADFRRKQ